MQVECYRKDAIKVEKRESNESKERKIICKELGLLKQAETTDCVKAEYYYPAMTENELFVWQNFLPTFYSKNKKEWRKYDFDIIPTKVLEEISFAVSLRVFTDIEIWTPETKVIDPYAVGLVGSRENKNIIMCGIVRWSESLIIPFSEIARIVFSRNQENATKEKIPQMVQEHMDKYTMSQKDIHQWNRGTICFNGPAFFKSDCCKTMAYKLKAGYETHLVCSECGKVKIKQPWGI